MYSSISRRNRTERSVEIERKKYAFTRDIEHWAAHPLAVKNKMGKSSVFMFTLDGSFVEQWDHLNPLYRDCLP